MKKTLLIALLSGGMVFSFSACNNAEDKIQGNKKEQSDLDAVDGDELPVFSFDSETHNFGQIPEGEAVSHEFSFTNTGSAPLIITSAKGSCGCTVPEWPRKPLAPGESGVIKVSFDSKGRSGRQDKTVTITANTVPNTKILKITSEVISGPSEENN